MTHQQILQNGILSLIYGFFDRHLHVREKEMLRLVLPYSVRQAWGGIIMPNLMPPVTTWERAQEYRAEIYRSLPTNSVFMAIMTSYLTDNTDLQNLKEGFERKVWHAVKFYPWGASTNSDNGVTSIEKAFPTFELMEKIGMPLLLHGELVHDKSDPLDFEKDFLERILVSEILHRFPKLKVVLEHITTKESVNLVRSRTYKLWATIAPQYLLYSHKHLFQTGSIKDGSFKRGIRPKFWCMPIFKPDEHREALLEAVGSEDSERFGAGTDSAPHPYDKKYIDLGCGGCLTSPYGLEMYAEGFERAKALHLLPNFLGFNLIQDVYGLDLPGADQLRNRPSLVRTSQFVDNDIMDDSGISVENLMGLETLKWTAILPQG